MEKSIKKEAQKIQKRKSDYFFKKSYPKKLFKKSKERKVPERSPTRTCQVADANVAARSDTRSAISSHHWL
jgi:hypothetical protein